MQVAVRKETGPLPVDFRQHGGTMNRILNYSIAGLFFAGMAIGASAQSASDQNVSLGSFARAERVDKKPDTSKHFDNDNMPRTDKLSVVGDANPQQAEDAAAPAPAQPSAQAANQASADEIKKEVTEQQSKVELLSRELTVAQKESQLHTSDMYGDAGNRLRNSASWDKNQTSNQSDIAQKQKDLDEAKEKLTDLQEQARKAGVTENDSKEQSRSDSSETKTADSGDSSDSAK
jgi:uncharacterized coiled-coil protein SlyX